MFTGNRVVITGMGILAANGLGRDAFWASLLEGRSGVGPVTLFDASSFASRIAGEVSDFDPLMVPGLSAKAARRMSRASQLAIAATHEALGDARISPASLAASPLPMFSGVSTTAMDLRAQRARSWSAVAGVPQAVVSAVAFTLGINARLVTLSTGCASGLDSVMAAVSCVASGESDIAIALSADSSMEPYTFQCFCGGKKVSVRNDDPEGAARPFDRDRDGGVIGEGAGAVIVENIERAQARGALCYSEVVGFGSCADFPGEAIGTGLTRAIKLALAHGCLPPSAVEAVNAHAPGDPHMDQIEVACLKQVFGEHAYRAPVYSIKGATGSPMAVGGMHQFVSASLGLAAGIIPMTTNLEHSCDTCDLDHVSGASRRHDHEVCLMNTHGFGRGNTALLARRPPEGMSRGCELRGGAT